MTQESHMGIPPSAEWNTGVVIWGDMAKECPFLGLRPGRWGFHNFLRNHRDALVKADAIRLAKNKFWIAHRERFIATAFELLTGKQPGEQVVQRRALGQSPGHIALSQGA